MARVLVVEDEPEVQATLCEMLARGGHEPIGARDGEAAMEDVRTLGYDLLITDIVMREVDGWQLIRWLRANRPAVPVIAISGGARALHPETALNLSKAYGAHRVLTKPVGQLLLLETVADLLRST